MISHVYSVHRKGIHNILQDIVYDPCMLPGPCNNKVHTWYDRHLIKCSISSIVVAIYHDEIVQMFRQNSIMSLGPWKGSMAMPKSLYIKRCSEFQFHCNWNVHSLRMLRPSEWRRWITLFMNEKTVSHFRLQLIWQCSHPPTANRQVTLMTIACFQKSQFLTKKSQNHEYMPVASIS